MAGGVFHRWQYLDEFEDVRNPPELGCTVLGLSEKAFWQRLARAQSDLVRARTAALERDRPAPAYRDLRIVGDDDSRRHGLEPIPLRLTASPQQIQDELHRSMWDVAIGQSLDEPVDVLAEAAAVADSVDAAIGAAWSIRERTRVHDTPPADSPDGPAALRPTV